MVKADSLDNSSTYSKGGEAMKRITLEQIEELPERERRQFLAWVSRNLRKLWNELHPKEKINEPND